MKKKKLNHNFEFMFAIMAMAIVVFGVVVFFWMWCFPQGAAETISPMQRYEVLLETGFKGDSVQLQLNDSVMFAARVTEDAVTVELSVPKQEKQSDFLMVLLPEKDMAYAFNLSADMPEVMLHNSPDGVTLGGE